MTLSKTIRWVLQRRHYEYFCDALAMTKLLSPGTKGEVLVWLVNLFDESFSNFDKDRFIERYRKKER